MQEAEETIPTRPYFIRAIYEWCTDNGFTPFLAVKVDENVQVPLEYVKNGEVVLNISFTATADMDLGNDFIRFQTRFAGSARQLVIPVDNVIAIYARENGQGMAFPAKEKAGRTEKEEQKKASGLHLVEDEQASEPQGMEKQATQDEGKDKSKKPSLRLVD